MGDWPTQSGNGVRFEWGPAGADRLVGEAACLVVVDVLSFTTAVSVAVGKGTGVLPVWWPQRELTAGERADVEKAAAAYARQCGARLAVHRAGVTPAAAWSHDVVAHEDLKIRNMVKAPEPKPDPESLSPAHLRQAPFVARLVLPSPNGAAICAAAAREVRLVAACLRNVTVVGGWLTAHGYGTPEHPVTVLAAGERWPDGSLRPAPEDLLGAGAVVSELNSQGADPASPEAAAAKAAYEGTVDVAHAVAAGSSGRQLAAMGFVGVVAIAAEEDTCSDIPVRDDDSAFVPG